MSGHADPLAPWTIFWIHFRGAQAIDHLANLGVSAARPVVSVDNPGVMSDAFEDTIRHANHGFAEAARAVGYDDPFYFSRLFRKHIGVAPSSCRHGP